VQQKKSPKSPDFWGLANINGQIVSVSAWYYPASQDGKPESFSLAIQPYDPNQQGQQQHGQAPQSYQPPQNGGGWNGGQQQMNYGHQQQQPPQGHYAPQGGGGGYAPAAGYTPPFCGG
jgi:hypothetical protein